MMAAVSLVYLAYSLKRGVFERRVYRGYLLATASVLILAMVSGAFETADVDFRLPAGAGLNPLLRDFWILVHPVFTFAGYTLTVALSLYILLSAKRDPLWERVVAGLSWLNLSIGIIAGGVWAYEVLGWGGYWAWDSVEVAELVPWLALTAYFHSTFVAGDGGRRLAAALAGFTTYYSSFMTKAGASFTASVHAFEWTPKATLLVVLHLAFGAAILVLYARRPGEFVLKFEKTTLFTAFSLAWWSLISLTFITFSGIFAPVVYGMVTGNLISVDFVLNAKKPPKPIQLHHGSLTYSLKYAAKHPAHAATPHEKKTNKRVYTRMRYEGAVEGV
jgi:cytochrome c-type biogenesis protein CcmF